MEKYNKLVKALRHCTDNKPSNGDCWNCPYQGEKCHTLLSNAADAIEALQAQLPKRGVWVEENRRPRSSQFVCSECHRTAYDPQPTRDKAWRKRCRYAYCPNCGADMRAKTEVQE